MDRGANRAIIVVIGGGMLCQQRMRCGRFGSRGGHQRARVHPL